MFQRNPFGKTKKNRLISILIPIFNFDIRHLVQDLSLQCKEAGLEYEIICFDDGSLERFKNLNRELKNSAVIYQEMHKNLGRSAIRNALGKAAKFPFLLFMDCDSKVVKKDYIQNYIDNLAPDTLLYGGRCYNAQPPKNQEYIFHWKYGIQREQSTVEQRMKNPWHSFMTNNFLIPKSIFEKTLFDELLKQYGHEDTLFGLQLAKKKIKIKHINNPLEHIGLETTDSFLKKTKQGLQNLYTLWERGTLIKTKLLTYFIKIKKWRLKRLVAFLFKMSTPFLERNFLSENPNLKFFDFYKLGYLCQLDKTNE